mgnify:CR=1 FL=1
MSLRRAGVRLGRERDVDAREGDALVRGAGVAVGGPADRYLAWMLQPVALLAATLVSLTPGFLYGSARVSNDIAAGAFATLGLWAGLRRLAVDPIRVGAALPLLLLAASVVAHLVILLFEHVFSPSPTRHHELATHTILRGAYSRLFWGVAIVGGGVVPVLMLLALGATFSPAMTAVAALLALAGGAAWEYIWVEAGQSVPLS